VAAGILESLVEATPRSIKHNYLWCFHSAVHPPGIGTSVEPYYTVTTLPTAIWKDLGWLIHYLMEHGEGQFARSIALATLISTGGDGSGTGTGGTFTVSNGPLKMWKGKKRPCVYQLSSNWKELSTLKLTLKRGLLYEDPTLTIIDTTVFYVSNKSTVYWISACSLGSSGSPHLHTLIKDICPRNFALDATFKLSMYRSWS
jgi:hypothetical protein